ncbi:hypothetical protein CCACVL1_21258 [Corchorus capsularis]|uniref:Uncharacterized protein n=1 Tax=Corchorus capsularis TaxID=210143 RepID=A0A1R3H7N9_COCAP|nr:hypothetical protein CCACVL1_21258 [Corchorus capsularis]
MAVASAATASSCEAALRLRTSGGEKRRRGKMRKMARLTQHFGGTKRK